MCVIIIGNITPEIAGKAAAANPHGATFFPFGGAGAWERAIPLGVTAKAVKSAMRGLCVSAPSRAGILHARISTGGAGVHPFGAGGGFLLWENGICGSSHDDKSDTQTLADLIASTARKGDTLDTIAARFGGILGESKFVLADTIKRDFRTFGHGWRMLGGNLCSNTSFSFSGVSYTYSSGGNQIGFTQRGYDLE
jgi:hypothetical protein